jgi:hypothetical protein
MSGVYQEAWSQRTCKRCLGAGRGEHHLQYVINDEGELSSTQVRCRECREVETISSAVGNDVRKRLIKAEKRAKTRAFALMAIGAFLTLGAIAIAASALAAFN